MKPRGAREKKSEAIDDRGRELHFTVVPAFQEASRLAATIPRNEGLLPYPEWPDTQGKEPTKCAICQAALTGSPICPE